jgi:hypothetical protein
VLIALAGFLPMLLPDGKPTEYMRIGDKKVRTWTLVQRDETADLQHVCLALAGLCAGYIVFRAGSHFHARSYR